MEERMKVFDPIEVNGMVLRNRLGFAPMLNMPRAEDWGPDEKTIKWLEARAEGGAGLVMTGTFLPIHPLMPGGAERFARLAEAVHVHGAKLGVQLGAGGPMSGQGPSAMPYPDELHPKQSIFEFIDKKISPMPGVESVREFTVEEIKQHVQAFAMAAKVLMEAGVDCVELHCAHGGATLYCSFISPFYNRRTDEYGGNWENRLRFPVETIRAMRDAVGKDYPILVRISADELLGPKGITLEDTLKVIVPALERAGVDCFDVSQGSILHSPQGITIPLYYPRGCYIHHAEAVKSATALPVIGVGRIVDLKMAEKFIQEGKADIIYMGRQLTSDPDTPRKFLEGREDEIRRCIGCLEGCGTPCSINYGISPEAKPLPPVKKAKHVVVVGGGVAGMEAARVCAVRGHRVTLMERHHGLGGAVAALAMDPLNAEFSNIVDYLGTQMRKLGVEVHNCLEVTAEMLRDIGPDVTILATGATLTIPKQADGRPGVTDHLQALRNRKGIGRQVVIWGLIYGAELAISLAMEGREVTLVGEGGEDAIARHAAPTRRWWVLKRLLDFNPVRVRPDDHMLPNLTLLLHTMVENVTAEGIFVRDREGRRDLLPFDTLIVSRGRKKRDSLYPEAQEVCAQVHKIGDCDTVANIRRAIWSANEVARMI